MVNVDSDSYAFMSIMGINPWSGRVYIWGADDAGSMMHTFQIKSSLRSPGQAWVQVLWNNISQSHGANYTYGNMGGLEYIHSHKLPYVNEYVNNDASSYNKVITFDPKTKLLKLLQYLHMEMIMVLVEQKLYIGIMHGHNLNKKANIKIKNN